MPTNDPSVTPPPQLSSAPSAPPPRRGRWGLRFLSILVFLGLLGAAWAWLSLTWDYSDGDRAGVLQKFSRKGWICKTWEGELAQYVVPGLAPQIWAFTVRDPKVADELTNHLGERVQLHYHEHRMIPTSCFGDTGYFVDHLVKAETPAR